MFTDMRPVRKLDHKVRNTNYELFVYQIEQTSECRVFVSKGGDGVGDVFTAYPEIYRDAKSSAGIGLVEELISAAIEDINRNEFGLY